MENNKLPNQQRRATPQKPVILPDIVNAAGSSSANSEHDELERFNQAASDMAKSAQLSKCPNCQRSFLPDRLAVHLRSCHKKTPTGLVKSAGKSTASAQQESTPSSDHQISRPQTVVCYICGRRQGFLIYNY